MAKKRLHILVSGLVQGVFFRAATKDTALSLGLGGWVRNIPDGRVEALFEGEEEALTKALEWCRHGPPGSRPVDVETNWEEYRGEFPDFRIAF